MQVEKELLLELSKSLISAGKLLEVMATGEIKEETEKPKSKKGKKDKEVETINETKNENKVEETTGQTPVTPSTTREKAYTTIKSPNPDEIHIWKAQWQRLTPAQQQDYIAGKIDSLGNKIVSEETKAPANESKFDASFIRAKLKAVSEKAGSKDKGYEFLKKFGAGKVDDLKSSDYAAIVQDMDAFLNSETAKAGDGW